MWLWRLFPVDRLHNWSIIFQTCSLNNVHLDVHPQFPFLSHNWLCLNINFFLIDIWGFDVSGSAAGLWTSSLDVESVFNRIFSPPDYIFPSCRSFKRQPLLLVSLDGLRAEYLQKWSRVIPVLDRLSECWQHYAAIILLMSRGERRLDPF